MRMYAACLASYNNGCLHGEWFDLEDYSDKEELVEAIAEKVLRTSPYPNVTVECRVCCGTGSMGEGHSWPCEACAGRGKVPSAEEWAAHDWDGEGLSGFGEYPDLDKVLEHVRLVGEHGDAWMAYVENVGEHYATEEAFADSYLGEYDSPEDWAAEYLEESGILSKVPDSIRGYFDYEAFARDARCDGTSFVRLNGSVFVFSE